MLAQKVNDLLTVFMKSLLDHCLISSNGLSLLRPVATLCLFASHYGPPARPSWCDQIFERYREHAPLLGCEVISLLKHWLKKFEHVLKPLSLLSQSGHKELWLHS